VNEKDEEELESVLDHWVYTLGTVYDEAEIIIEDVEVFA